MPSCTFCGKPLHFPMHFAVWPVNKRFLLAGALLAYADARTLHLDFIMLPDTLWICLFQAVADAHEREGVAEDDVSGDTRSIVRMQTISGRKILVGQEGQHGALTNFASFAYVEPTVADTEMFHQHFHFRRLRHLIVLALEPRVLRIPLLPLLILLHWKLNWIRQRPILVFTSLSQLHRRG